MNNKESISVQALWWSSIIGLYMIHENQTAYAFIIMFFCFIFIACLND